MSIAKRALEDRIAIVTGGATGIGAATARLFARQGAHVVICSRTADELNRAAADIEATTDRRCLPIPTDVKDEAQVARLVQQTMDAFGRIDILVNNAGGSRLGPLKALTTKAWDSSFDLNVRSAYLCTREVGRHMLAQRSGAIVNISSRAGGHGVKGGAHYSSAKAALEMFTRVTASEWGRHGIRVNCVEAGMIASERAVDAWRVAQLDTNSASMIIPLGRTGTPDEVANAIFFFVSDAASYITGQVIAVDGGPTMSGIPDSML